MYQVDNRASRNLMGYAGAYHNLCSSKPSLHCQAVNLVALCPLPTSELSRGGTGLPSLNAFYFVRLAVVPHPLELHWILESSILTFSRVLLAETWHGASCSTCDSCFLTTVTLTGPRTDVSWIRPAVVHIKYYSSSCHFSECFWHPAAIYSNPRN